MDLASSSDESTEARLLAASETITRKHATLDLEGKDVVDLARDVMTECLVAMRAGTWKVSVSLVRLVVTMTRTPALNGLEYRKHCRARVVAFTHYLVESTHGWMSPELTLEQETLDDLHEQTLASLPHNCRRAYVMVREERERYQAVADHLGMSRLAACSHVVTAQHRFRERLREEDIAAPPPAPGPTERDELAHQRNAGAAEQNGEAHQKNAERTDGQPPRDAARRSSASALPSPAPAKRRRKRPRRRAAPPNRGADNAHPPARPPERRVAPSAMPTGHGEPPTAIDSSRVCTYSPHASTGAPAIATDGARACLARSATA
jgi:DNA-directed RNA polymerase specialized sigma24 family protein